MIILASASPRRKELLSLFCKNFAVEPSKINETVTEKIEITKYPEYLAEKKAQHILHSGHKNDIIIGCDTGVFVNNKMLGKPSDKSDAAAMLKMLSGKKHSVITGCCVLSNQKKVVFSQTTDVEFYNLSSEEINEYILIGEPMDKAGAYGIQGKGSLLVKKICGDYFNVVGLPVAELSRVLKAF